MSADFSRRKLLTIEKLSKLENEDVLIFIEQLLDSGESEDWANHLSDKDKKDIEEGIKDLDEGNTENYEDFKKRMNEKHK